MDITHEDVLDCDTHNAISEKVIEMLVDRDYTTINCSGRCTDPVTVDGAATTPYQCAGTSISMVVSWLHSEGGAPNNVVDESDWRRGVVIPPDDEDDGKWDIKWDDDPIFEVELPKNLDNLTVLEVRAAIRLAKWAEREINMDTSDFESLVEDLDLTW